MIRMTLLSQHRNRNWSPVSLSSSTLSISHRVSTQYWQSELRRDIQAALTTIRGDTVNMQCWPNVGLMLGHRLQRGPSIKPTLSHRIPCLLPAVRRGTHVCYVQATVWPSNTGHSPNAVSMLAHRLRRWPNIETALDECPVFAGDRVHII